MPMSSITVTDRAGGCFLLKLVAMVFILVCNIYRNGDTYIYLCGIFHELHIHTHTYIYIN